MLVISRHVQEAFTIFDPSGKPLIRVRLLDVRGDKSRIGIDAPQEYGIKRDELIEDDRDDQPSEAA